MNSFRHRLSHTSFEHRRPWFGNRLRWFVWFVFGAAWTVALLVPHPLRVEAAIQEKVPVDIFFFSKAVHVAAYAVLTLLSGWLQLARPWRWGLLLFISLHAIATEYSQHFVPTRTPSWGDVGLDHAGAILGFLLTYKWWVGRSKPAP